MKNTGGPSLARSVRTWVALKATLGLLVGLLTVVLSAGPAAAASCTGGATVTASSGGVSYSATITPLHGKVFYVDPKNSITAAYVGFQVANNSASAIKDAWVKLSSFGTVVKLANNSDEMMQIGNIPAKAGSTPGTGVAFFYMKASGVTNSTQSFNVTVYDGRPDGAAAVNIGTCSNDFIRVDQTIAANANKVTSITVNTTTPQLGDSIVVTVNGVTGTGGAGDATGDGDVMWLSPASAVNWPTYSVRLESTSLCIKKNSTSCTAGNYTNVLLVSGINKNGSGQFTSKTSYTATYTFRVIAPATFDPTVSPVAQIASGTQMKHTGSYPATPSAIQLTRVNTATFVVTKTAASGLVTSAFCSGKSKAAVRYTITSTLQSPATAGKIDEVVDQPASTAELDTTNSNVTVTDVNNTAGTTWPSSKIVKETLSGSNYRLHFVGLFEASSTRSITIAYTMCVPWNSTTSNSGYAKIGPTVVGYNSTQICAASVTIGASGSSTGSVSTSCSTSKPKLTQTITFDALGTAGVGDQVNLVATTNSGNPVTFTTTTTSKCSVSNSGSTWTVTAVATTDASNPCTVTANADGDTYYDPAAPVSQNLAIQAGQTIVMTPSSLSNMNTNATQTFTAQSVRTSDNSIATGLSVTATSLTTDVCTVASTATANQFRITSATTVGTCYLVLSSGAGTGTGGLSYAAAATVEPSLVVGSAQTIDFPQPGDQASTTSPLTTFTVTATSKTPAGAVTNLTIDFNTSTPDICTLGTESISSGVTSVTVTKAKAGYCTLIASQAGNATYSPASDVVRSLNIGSPQTISFGALSDVPYTSSSKSISASTTSSLQVTFTSSNSSYCTVGSASLSGGTTAAIVTRVAQGPCTITASQSGNASWWAAADVVQSFTFLGSTSQTITFNQPATPTNISGSLFAAPATASSGLPIQYTSTDKAICTIADDGTVTMLRVGDCVLNADQSGNTTYAPATRVTRTVVIQAKPVIGFTTSNKSIIDGSVTLTSTHTYSVPSTSESIATGLNVSYSSTTSDICTVSGAVATFVKTGTCTVRASQAGSGNFLASDSVSSSFTISAATQTITFVQPSDVTYTAGGSRSITASTNSKLLISFASSTTSVCTVGSSSVDASGVTTVSIGYVAVGSCQLTASQSGNGTYSAASNVIRTFSIGQASQTIDFPSLSAMTYGDTLDIAGQSSASSGLDVTYAVSGGCTLSGTTITITVGGGTCSVTASQAGNTNYKAAASVTNSFNTNKRSLVVTAEAASKKPGDPDPTFTYTYTGSLKFGDKFTGSLSRANSGVNTAGTYAITRGNLDVNSNYDITFNSAELTITDKTVPGLSWSTPTAITYGVAIANSTHLNASATVDGTKTYTYKKAGVDTAVQDGDVLEAGTYTFTVNFAPNDNANYAATSKSVTVQINKKTISTTVSVSPREYDGSTSFTPSFTTLSNVESADTSNVEIDTAYFEVKSSSAEVGTYSGTAVYLPNDRTGLKGIKASNYTLSYNSTLTAEITAKVLTLSISNTSKEYDGSDSATLSYTLSGKVGSDDVSVDTANLTVVYSSADASDSKTISITKKSGTGLAGTKKNNYSVTIPSTLSGSITKKAVTVSGTAANKEYDGTTTAVLTISGLTGVIAADTSNVSAVSDDIIGTFASADVGSRSVTISKSPGKTGLTGTKAGNYTLSSSSVSASITEREITLTADNKSITAGSSTPTFTWIVSRSGGGAALVGSDSISGITKNFVSSDGSSSSSAPTAAGTYTIVPTSAVFGSGNSNNYKVNYVNGTYRINPSSKTPQNITITDPGVKTYGDAEVDISATTDASGLTVTLVKVSGPCEIVSGKLKFTGAGQCEIKGDQAGDDTYDSATATRYITINKKILNITGVTVNDKEYDGTKSATLGLGSKTVSGKVGDDDVDLDTAAGTFGSADVGDSKSVSVTFTLKGTKKDFYDASFNTLSAKITRRTLSVTATVTDKVYDGTTSASVVYSALDRTIEGDEVSLKVSDFNTTFGSPDVGESKSVTITRNAGASGLQGAQKDNYQLNSLASPVGKITPKATTVRLVDKSKIEGDPDPSLTWTISGFVGSDFATCTNVKRNAGESVGTYSISATCSVGSNYIVTVVSGTFTISARPTPEPDPTPPTPPLLPAKEKTKASAKTKVDTPVEVEVKGVVPGAKLVLTDEVKKIRDLKVEIDPSNGKLSLTPINGWTGKIVLPVLTEKDGKQVEVETLIVVNPAEPEKTRSEVKALRETIVTWEAAAGAIRYDVDMDGKQICSTSATACAVNEIVGPKSKIEVTAIGNDETKSAPRISPYAAEKPFAIQTLPFAINKSVLSSASKRDLDEVVAIVKAKGFTKMVIDGHTDSTWPKVNAALSKSRAQAVVVYLKKYLPDVNFTLQGYAATKPRATNATTQGKALNRRAEIKLW